MNWFLVLLGLLIGQLICMRIMFAIEFYMIAEKKGHPKIKYLIYALVFGVIGYMMVKKNAPINGAFFLKH